MDQYSIQCILDVHWAIFCISWWPARRPARPVGLRVFVYPGQLSASLCSEPSGNARLAGARGPDSRNLLPSHFVLRLTQSSHAVCAAGHRDVCRGHSVYHQLRYFAGSVVLRPLVLALDLLEQRRAHPGDDGPGVFRYPMAAVAQAQGGAAQTELERFPLRQPWIFAPVYRARSRATVVLDELRRHRRSDGFWSLPARRSPGAPFRDPESADQLQVSCPAEHPFVERSSLLFSFHDARNGG